MARGDSDGMPGGFLFLVWTILVFAGGMVHGHQKGEDHACSRSCYLNGYDVGDFEFGDCSCTAVVTDDLPAIDAFGSQ